MSQATTSAGRPVSASPDGSDDLVIALFDVIRHSRRPIAKDELDPPAVVVLASVARLDPARPSDIACDVRLNLSTVSRHLTNLGAGGYVARADDPADGRAQRVSITDLGVQALRRAVVARTEVLDTATRSWSEDDRSTLTALMRRLADDLDAIAVTRRTARKDNA
jgi:DNA-binding MarR family transcriptional regulator